MIRMLRDPFWPPAVMALFWLFGLSGALGLIVADVALIAAVWSLIVGGCP